jgi:hypothetical protein
MCFHHDFFLFLSGVLCVARVFVARYMNCAEYDTTRRRKVMVNATTRLLALEARHEDDTRFRDDEKAK